jgi:hypothetical protein
MDSIAAEHPGLVMVDTLGLSHVQQLPMPYMKLSDNPGEEEDEPAILYDGLHHAREPMGMETIIMLVELLLSNYESDPQVQFWVDNVSTGAILGG